MRSLLERFWAAVVPGSREECWLWRGRLVRGYGVLGIGGKRALATHVSLMAHGRPLLTGQWALHHCDTPACVNPYHLFAGDHLANVADKVRKGRQARGATHSAACSGRHPIERHNSRARPETVPRGSAHGLAKLDELKVAEIRRRRRSGETFQSIATSFGITDVCARNAATGRTWAHVPMFGGS